MMGVGVHVCVCVCIYVYATTCALFSCALRHRVSRYTCAKVLLTEGGKSQGYPSRVFCCSRFWASSLLTTLHSPPSLSVLSAWRAEGVMFDPYLEGFVLIFCPHTPPPPPPAGFSLCRFLPPPVGSSTHACQGDVFVALFRGR